MNFWFTLHHKLICGSYYTINIPQIKFKEGPSSSDKSIFALSFSRIFLKSDASKKHKNGAYTAFAFASKYQFPKCCEKYGVKSFKFPRLSLAFVQNASRITFALCSSRAFIFHGFQGRFFV